ncbi:MAG: hypothetical protein QSU88_07260, partial [Candidatus Methanoperedens sp.]|nr:hypothetical protein [Candidatus Methanoperedens sp.]
MSDIEKRKLIEKELDYLRTELHDLKDCQIKFIAFAVTGTGFLFGIVSLKDIQNIPYSPLIPLLIIIPTWWIFFDKAKTISRIIGYYRILEYLYIDSENKYLKKFHGWETARAQYREQEKNGKKEEKGLFSKDKLLDLIFLRASSYWTISYGIFFALLVICIFMYILKSGYNSINTVSGLFLSILFLLIIIISILDNFSTLLQLIWGKHSYDANT